MAQKDGFTGGFILGAIVGGVVGGILGTVLANRANNASGEEKNLLKFTKQQKLDTEDNLEGTRRNLEDKIAQLNSVIDDVREQLGTGSLEEMEN
jgi:Na+/glutamate symporter